MTEYYYHGSPLRFSEIREARPGEGIYLTPSRALAGMFGAMRNVKDSNKGWGTMWEYDLYSDYDKTGNDTPRAFNALSNLRGMKDRKGKADVYIHKIPLTTEHLKLLRQLGKSPLTHKVRFAGPELPVESVEKVTIPYTAKYNEEMEKRWGPAVKLGAAKLDTEINNLLKDYQWQAIDPDSEKMVYKPDDMCFVSAYPIPYSYQKGSEAPFKGNCVEQSLFVKEHFPDAKILFSRKAKPGINWIHATPLFEDNGYYRHVRCKPLEGKNGIQQYLTGKRFTNLKRFLQSRSQIWDDPNIDFYVLDDIPKTGDSRTLQQFADQNATPIRVRNGKVLGKNKFEKNFRNIVDRYKKLYDIDLSDVNYIEDPLPKYNNGEYTDQFTPEESGGSWLRSNGKRFISINPNPQDVIKHWNLDVTPTQFVNHILAHELAHDVAHTPEYKEFAKRMIEEAKKQNFTTPYLDDVAKNRKHKLNSETFAEYMAHLINQKGK